MKNNQIQSVIFLHIPKTAGSTLQTILKQQYELNEIFYVKNFKPEPLDELSKMPETQRKKIKIFTGHMYFGLHEFLPQPSTYITIIRNPIERVISHYCHVIRRGCDHHLHQTVTSHNMSIKDYVCSGVTTEINNGQVRLLSGIPGMNSSYAECPDTMLETAKKNLQKHFSIIGLTERFDETLILLQKKVGWRLPFYCKQNVNHKKLRKEEISKDTLDCIVKFNELDMELYEYAQKNFEQTIIQQYPYIHMDLKVFKLLNNYHSSVNSFSRTLKHKLENRFTH